MFFLWSLWPFLGHTLCWFSFWEDVLAHFVFFLQQLHHSVGIKTPSTVWLWTRWAQLLYLDPLKRYGLASATLTLRTWFHCGCVLLWSRSMVLFCSLHSFIPKWQRFRSGMFCLPDIAECWFCHSLLIYVLLPWISMLGNFSFWLFHLCFMLFIFYFLLLLPTDKVNLNLI